MTFNDFVALIDSPEKLHVLKSEGLNINTTDHMGSTLLHVAVSNNNSKVIPELIKLGVGVNRKDFVGQTPMDIAFIKEYTECSDMLKSFGGRLGYFNIDKKMLKQEMTNLVKFLKLNSIVDMLDKFSKLIDDSMLAVFIKEAIKSDNFDILNVLIEHNPQVLKSSYTPNDGLFDLEEANSSMYSMFGSLNSYGEIGAYDKLIDYLMDQCVKGKYLNSKAVLDLWLQKID